VPRGNPVIQKPRKKTPYIWSGPVVHCNMTREIRYLAGKRVNLVEMIKSIINPRIPAF
jgi:hypothetical protein